MKFSKIVVNNFRQYHGQVSIDLDVNGDKNIILIGGKNGYGKTNFLISIVWCLYGKQLEKVDENFKQEIRKEKNYDSFMRESLNWTAKEKGSSVFSVSMKIKDIDLPELSNINSKTEVVSITRTYDINKMEESLTISDAASDKILFEDEDDKLNFINDYIIPIDAAKFVFFDAEKISEIANLSIKKEGDFINDALGKILGLDIYNTLIDDIDFYVNTLKKEGANRNMQEEIINKEKAIEIYGNDIEKLIEDNADKQKQIDKLKKDIRDFDNTISRNSKQGNSSLNRNEVINEIETIKQKEKELSEKFTELSEVIPLAILTGKLEEVMGHLETQESNNIFNTRSKENGEKIKLFIDKLFNKPPYPEDSHITLDDQLFYRNKATSIGKELFDNNDESFVELPFEHDLNNAEKNLIEDGLKLVNTQSKDLFENTIDDYNKIQIKLEELQKIKSKIDAGQQDEFILETIAKKESSEHERDLLKEQIGANKSKVEGLKKDIGRLENQLVTLVKKVEVNEENKLKIEESQKYIDVLNYFLEEQKNNHKKSLENNILSELKILMHKLNSSNNENKFIEDVDVTILPSGQGMIITLLDQNDNEIRKESLSSGEKQIYISSLIKAIISESTQSLPIFIDTPLGRLDQDHRDSVTKQYYPELSEQVILFSTDSEITPKRHKSILDDISKSYLLVHDGINTKIKNGYFNTLNDD